MCVAVQLISTLLLINFFHFKATASRFDENPFWQKKPKVLRRMSEERSIVVSVRNQKLQGGKKSLDMSGAGVVRAEFKDTYKQAQNYTRLTEASDHIKEVKLIDRQTLLVRTEAFGYQAKMTMRVKEVSEPEQRHQIHFEVIEGHFKGMVGRFTFDEFESTKTLLGFQAFYHYEKLPMPTFFVEFGLEVVLKIVAQKLRAQLEKTAAL